MSSWRGLRSLRGVAGSAEPCQPDLYNFRFAADKGFLDKLERTAEVGGMGDALRNMREVLERTLDEYLERKDPEERLALWAMSESGWACDREVYALGEDYYDGIDLFASKEEAEQEMANWYSDEPNLKKWVDMEERELSEWMELLESES